MDEGAGVDPQEHNKIDDVYENNSSGKVLQEESASILKEDSREDGQVITTSVSISRENSLTSLLAGSDNEDEEDHDSIDFAAERQPLKRNNDSQSQPYGKKKHTLTKLQDEILYSVESVNTHYFVDLGGVFYYDINFSKGAVFPLKVAATRGSENFVRLLLNNVMVDVNKQDPDGLNAFWIAARLGHGDVCRALAEYGVDIYNADKNYNNALHISARSKDLYGILRMLVLSNYDLDLQNIDGDTATHIAAGRGNFRHLKLMVDEGSDIDTLNQHSFSPLYLAILNNNNECANYLISAGAKGFYGDNQLSMDRSPVFLAIRNENEEVLTKIFETESLEQIQSFRNSLGQTPVMFAAKNNYFKALNSLLALNSTVINEEDNNQKTILMHVLDAQTFDRKLARKLIMEWGADVNHIDSYGNSILIKLVKEKKNALVEFMLRRGAKMHIVDSNSKDACDYAKSNGLALQIRQFLNCGIKKKEADMKALNQKWAEHKAELAKSLKNSRASIATKGSKSTRKRRGSRRPSRRETGELPVNNLVSFKEEQDTADFNEINERDEVMELDPAQLFENNLKQSNRKRNNTNPAAQEFESFRDLSLGKQKISITNMDEKDPQIITRVVHQNDPKFGQDMKKILDEMQQRQIATINATRQKIQLENESREVTQLKQQEDQNIKQKQMPSQSKLKDEAKEIKAIIDGQKELFREFKQKIFQSAERLAQLTEYEITLLERQKSEAKRIYNENQLRRQQLKMTDNPSAGAAAEEEQKPKQILTEADENNLNAEALMKAQKDTEEAQKDKQREQAVDDNNKKVQAALVDENEARARVEQEQKEKERKALIQKDQDRAQALIDESEFIEAIPIAKKDAYLSKDQSKQQQEQPLQEAQIAHMELQFIYDLALEEDQLSSHNQNHQNQIIEKSQKTSINQSPAQPKKKESPVQAMLEDMVQVVQQEQQQNMFDQDPYTPVPVAPLFESEQDQTQNNNSKQEMISKSGTPFQSLSVIGIDQKSENIESIQIPKFTTIKKKVKNNQQDVYQVSMAEPPLVKVTVHSPQNIKNLEETKESKLSQSVSEKAIELKQSNQAGEQSFSKVAKVALISAKFLNNLKNKTEKQPHPDSTSKKIRNEPEFIIKKKQININTNREFAQSHSQSTKKLPNAGTVTDRDYKLNLQQNNYISQKYLLPIGKKGLEGQQNEVQVKSKPKKIVDQQISNNISVEPRPRKLSVKQFDKPTKQIKILDSQRKKKSLVIIHDNLAQLKENNSSLKDETIDVVQKTKHTVPSRAFKLKSQKSLKNPSMSSISRTIDKSPPRNVQNTSLNLEKLTPVRYENGFKEYYNSNNHTPNANILTLDPYVESLANLQDMKQKFNIARLDELHKQELSRDQAKKQANQAHAQNVKKIQRKLLGESPYGIGKEWANQYTAKNINNSTEFIVDTQKREFTSRRQKSIGSDFSSEAQLKQNRSLNKQHSKRQVKSIKKPNLNSSIVGVQSKRKTASPKDTQKRGRKNSNESIKQSKPKPANQNSTMFTMKKSYLSARNQLVLKTKSRMQNLNFTTAPPETQQIPANQMMLAPQMQNPDNTYSSQVNLIIQNENPVMKQIASVPQVKLLPSLPKISGTSATQL